MADRHLLIVICILTSAAISNTSHVVSTQIGQTKTLKCPVQLGSDLQFLYWRKDGTTIYSLTNNGESSTGKYSVVDTTSLVISDVEDSDAGNYSCKVVRQSLETEESDLIKLYVLDLAMSQCSFTLQGAVDDCSCHVDGANITSLVCTASGFFHSPAISWMQNDQVVGFSSVDLTQFHDNVTLICNAWDKNIESVAANKAVCVFYNKHDNDVRTAEPTVVANKAAIALLSIPMLVLLVLFILLMAWCLYRHKKGYRNHLPTSCPCPCLSKSAGCNEVNERDFQRVHEDMKKDEDDKDSIDLPPKDCNEAVMVDEQEQQAIPLVERDPLEDIPLVGRVLFDDLHSSTEESRRRLKAVISRLLKKRVKPYKDCKQHMDASVTLKSSFLGMSMQGSVVQDTSGDRDVAFVFMVLKELDRIGDPSDRDECEILITKPDFQEVTDETQIPAYTGKMFSVSFAGQPVMSSSMSGSMTMGNPMSDLILAELRSKTPLEKTAARNAISQIILDFLREGKGRNPMKLSTEGFVPCISQSLDLPDNDSRIVALWTSKTAKLDDDVNSSINEYLFPLKTSISKESSESSDGKKVIKDKPRPWNPIDTKSSGRQPSEIAKSLITGAVI